MHKNYKKKPKMAAKSLLTVVDDCENREILDYIRAIVVHIDFEA